jgi:hypothetical protein
LDSLLTHSQEIILTNMKRSVNLTLGILKSLYPSQLGCDERRLRSDLHRRGGFEAHGGLYCDGSAYCRDAPNRSVLEAELWYHMVMFVNIQSIFLCA